MAPSVLCGVSLRADFRGFTGAPCDPCFRSHAAGPLCTFMATPEERARLTSSFHGLGEDALEGTRLPLFYPLPLLTRLSQLCRLTCQRFQFHTDQALIARQLAETSTSRARAPFAPAWSPSFVVYTNRTTSGPPHLPSLSTRLLLSPWRAYSTTPPLSSMTPRPS